MRIGGDASAHGWLSVAALDTTTAVTASGPVTLAHRGHCRWRIVGGVIWLAVVMYVLWLATRVVRAVERIADRHQGRAP